MSCHSIIHSLHPTLASITFIFNFISAVHDWVGLVVPFSEGIEHRGEWYWCKERWCHPEWLPCPHAMRSPSFPTVHLRKHSWQPQRRLVKRKKESRRLLYEATWIDGQGNLTADTIIERKLPVPTGHGSFCNSWSNAIRAGSSGSYLIRGVVSLNESFHSR